MTHVFVAPHPDDVALSCGGLIAGLRELGQNVTILTVFSGEGEGFSDPDAARAGDGRFMGSRREVLGYGTKAVWPVTEAFNRAHILPDEPVYGDPGSLPAWAATDDRLEATQADADAAAKRFWQRSSWYRRASIRAEPLAGQPIIDALPTQGPVLTEEVMEAAASGDLQAKRRLEDEAYALFAEASVVFLDLPDAVYRGYEGEAELLGPPRLNDKTPYDVLRREIDRLEPQKLYLPLGVGNHVDHQICRDVGVRLLAEGRRWVMPGPEYASTVVFYEDFPYAWWGDFERIENLPPTAWEGLPEDVGISPEYADIDDQIERKITGISLYQSQMDRLFGGAKDMGRQVRAYGRRISLLGGGSSTAERYWAARPA